MIPFHKPYFTGAELGYLQAALQSGKIAGDGPFTHRCQQFFEARYHFPKTLLTTSCTDALEMAAILLNIQAGDEVIIPSFTFVSSANPFLLRGAKVVFADSSPLNPNLDETTLEALITPRTKAIVVVHYAGVACNMNAILRLAQAHQLSVVEDAAQGLDSYFESQPLGSLGTLSAFSFHDTKNIIAGEGGMLVINDPALMERAEIIREKGTNRSRFFRGEIDQYGWIDIGSSFLPSDLVAACLYAQLQHLTDIQHKRLSIWAHYLQRLQPLLSRGVQLPFIPAYATHNANLFYLVTRSASERSALLAHLKDKGIATAFHYQALHQSAYYAPLHDGRPLPQAQRYADCLLRLPLYYELPPTDQDYLIDCLLAYFQVA